MKPKNNTYTEEQLRELLLTDTPLEYERNIDVGENEDLSIDFIREFADKLSWHNISCWQNLSEKAIEEFKENVDWWYISKKQFYSIPFIEKWKGELDWFWVVLRNKSSKKFMDKYKEEIEKRFGE